MRGSLNIAGEVRIVLAGGLALSPDTGFGFTAGMASMPTGPEAKRIERDVTVATIVQLVASFAVPAVVIAAGYSDRRSPSPSIVRSDCFDRRVTRSF